MNRELSRDNERLTFVTAIVGCLDLASGRLALVDAGHNPAVLIAPDGRDLGAWPHQVRRPRRRRGLPVR